MFIFEKKSKSKCVLRATAFLMLLVMVFSCVPIAYAGATDVQQSNNNLNMTGDEEGYVNSARDIRNSEVLTDMRGVWIAFVDYKNMGLYNKSETVFRNNASKMFAKLKSDNINTVFFHVVIRVNILSGASTCLQKLRLMILSKFSLNLLMKMTCHFMLGLIRTEKQ